MLDLDVISNTYEIIEEIGSGGGGTVYKGYHKRLEKYIVIKKIHEEVQDILNSRAEADILKNLRHEYLPQVFDFLDINGSVYTVMDYIPGKSFQQLLDEGEAFSQKQVIKWAKQLAEALDYLHKQNPPIIHGDIKPANIMLTPKGDICLIDFNISSVFDTGDNQPIGFSEGYSPPEQYPEIIRKQKIEEHISKINNSKMYSKPIKVKKLKSLQAMHLDDNKKSSSIQRTENNKQTEKVDFTEAFGNTVADSENTTLMQSTETFFDKTEIFDQEYVDDISDRTEIYNYDENNAINPNGTIHNETSNIIGFNLDEKDNLRLTNDQSAYDYSKQKTALDSVKFKKTYIDERSDIYSLGATLYHLISGNKPSCSLFGVESIDINKTKISDGFNYVITKMMNPSPNKRFESTSRLLKSLNQMSKLDKRYKHFVLKREIVAIVMMLLFALSIISIYHGKSLLQLEKEELYEDYIAQMITKGELEDYNSVEEIYNKAISLFPVKLDAYYQRVLTLYKQGLYKEDIEFVDAIFNETIIDYNIYNTDSLKEMLGDIKYILGNCYFELEDYSNASLAFKDAIMYYPQNSDYYRDYAISLVRINHIDDATRILGQALELNLSEDNIHLIKGELDLANDDYQKAISEFMECIRNTKSDYIANRAYVMCSRAFEEAGELIDDSQLRNIELLEEARVKLPVDMTLIINEQLAEAYVEYGMSTNDNSYYEKAIDILTFIKDMGWYSYQTYNNLSMLYRRLGDYERAYVVLETMLNQYGDVYNTYKRLAYLETDIQKSKKNEERGYQLFKEYYGKAKALYKEEMKNNKNDIEMDYLDQVYSDLVDGNWLD